MEDNVRLRFTLVFFSSTFEFVELLPQLASCQLMDAVRNGVLVVQRLVAGVHDGGAVELSNIPNAAIERNAVEYKCKT